MTIKEFIIEKEMEATKDRFEKLTEMGAPEILLRNIEKQIAEMQDGNIQVGGDKKLLDCEAVTYMIKKGNGGRLYIEFENGIKYFPNAKYGRFISR